MAAIQPESLHEKTTVVNKPAEQTITTDVLSLSATKAATSEKTERTGNEKADVPAIARDRRPSAKLTAPVTTNSGNINPAVPPVPNTAMVTLQNSQ